MKLSIVALLLIGSVLVKKNSAADIACNPKCEKGQKCVQIRDQGTKAATGAECQEDVCVDKKCPEGQKCVRNGGYAGSICVCNGDTVLVGNACVPGGTAYPPIQIGCFNDKKCSDLFTGKKTTWDPYAKAALDRAEGTDEADLRKSGASCDLLGVVGIRDVNVHHDHPQGFNFDHVDAAKMTIAICLKLCNDHGLTFAAPNGGGCFCDNKFGRFGMASDAVKKTTCQATCAGNSGDERCGNGNVQGNTVFYDKPVSCPYNANSPFIISLGCFKINGGGASDTSNQDMTSLPAANLYYWTDPAAPMTQQKCIIYCRDAGFKFAGIANGAKCACGDRYDNFGQAITCNVACAGDANQLDCGGPDAHSVFYAAKYECYDNNNACMTKPCIKANQNCVIDATNKNGRRCECINGFLLQGEVCVKDICSIQPCNKPGEICERISDTQRKCLCASTHISVQGNCKEKNAMLCTQNAALAEDLRAAHTSFKDIMNQRNYLYGNLTTAINATGVAIATVQSTLDQALAALVFYETNGFWQGDWTWQSVLAAINTYQTVTGPAILTANNAEVALIAPTLTSAVKVFSALKDADKIVASCKPLVAP